MGGMGIVNPASMSQCIFEESVRVTSPLVNAIVTQDWDQKVDIFKVMEVKVCTAIRSWASGATIQECLRPPLPPAEELYWPCKRERCLFLDCLFFHWMIMAFPSTRALSRMQYACVMAGSHQIPLPNATVTQCSQPTMPWSVLGGFPTIRHNELRNITASLLSEVCIASEPCLQPLNGESMIHCTANTTDDSRLNIRVRRFWFAIQDAYFDTKMLHPSAQNNNSGSISAVRQAWELQEMGKRPACSRCWAQSLHYPHFFHHWRG